MRQSEAGPKISIVDDAMGVPARPPENIDPDQAWFWTPEWQAGEREADAEIAAGGGEIFMSGEEFIAALEDAAGPEARRMFKDKIADL